MVYINTPSDLSYLELERLQLSRRVVPAGFVFVWADKESIPAVLSIFEKKGFFYVENLVWVRSHDEDTVPLDDVFLQGMCVGRGRRCCVGASERC